MTSSGASAKMSRLEDGRHSPEGLEPPTHFPETVCVIGYLFL